MQKLNYPTYMGLPVIRPLTTTGDTLGTFNAIGNYSASITDFYYQVPDNYSFLMTEVSFTVSHATKLEQYDYGGITGGISNGIKIFLRLRGVEVQILANQVIKQNNDFYVLTFSVEKSNFSGIPQTLTASFRLLQDYGMPLYLESGDRIIIRLNDSFLDLSAHKFVAKGILI